MSQDREPAALEARVAELAATVDGLTEELVDAKERIRELEVELGIREDTVENLDGEKTVEELFEEAKSDPLDEDERNSIETGEDRTEDDIIVG